MSNLPKIKDIYENIELAIKKDGLIVVLNQPPKVEWVKEHPYIKGYKYLPIERIEFLLKSIFKTDYKIEVLKTGLLLNTVEVTVRVHFRDIITKEWMFHDGVGAQEIQTQKNTGHLLLDMSNINRGAVTMALPIAKTMAIKDACDNIGNIFGANLNRKDIIHYEQDLTLTPMDEMHPNWLKVCEAIKSGKFKVADISEKYTLTDESREQLTKLQNGSNTINI
ncbi:hypothetical protein UFOVP756_29 [uncultured Caudovirales phage]|uniref:Uncharacterized protein n=1 Tax=uncultured Caudovirales phage TaxID=2100421 RepID=A0A6J7X5X4_9CAUD|nr:hypothetical protein UFOVP756_29 [uncultured Caudovirales phage]